MAGGPRWLVATAIAGMSLAGLPVVIWACLPVRHALGPIRMEARPSSLFSDTFEVRTVNHSQSEEQVRNKEIRDANWSPKYLICEAGRFSFPRAAGWSSTDFIQPGVTYGFNPVTPGLHRIEISRGGSYSTDIWVLNVAGRTFAVK